MTNKVYIRNIPSGVDEESIRAKEREIRKKLAKFGEIKSLDLKPFRKNKIFCEIEFAKYISKKLFVEENKLTPLVDGEVFEEAMCFKCWDDFQEWHKYSDCPRKTNKKRKKVPQINPEQISPRFKEEQSQKKKVIEKRKKEKGLQKKIQSHEKKEEKVKQEEKKEEKYSLNIIYELGGKDSEKEILGNIILNKLKHIYLQNKETGEKIPLSSERNIFLTKEKRETPRFQKIGKTRKRGYSLDKSNSMSFSVILNDSKNELNETDENPFDY